MCTWGVLCVHVSCGSHVSAEYTSVGCTLCACVMSVSCECRVHECGVYWMFVARPGKFTENTMSRVMWVSCECRVHECGVYFEYMCHVGLM